MKKTFVIHLGAHKTGTSFIQQTLRKNAEILAENGIDLIPDQTHRIRKILRGDQKGDLSGLFDDVGKTAADLTIYSCEDVLRFAGISHPEHLYDDLDPILNRLATAIPQDVDLRVLFSIRSFPAYIASVYHQEVRRNRTGMEFGAYVSDRVTLDKVSWRNVIDGLSKTFEGKLIVWPHEVFRAEPLKVWPYFGIDASLYKRLESPRSDVNASLSKVTADIMRGAFGKISEDDRKKLEKFLTKTFPKGDAYPGEQLWDDADRNALDARYIADLREVEAIVESRSGQFLKI